MNRLWMGVSLAVGLIVLKASALEPTVVATLPLADPVVIPGAVQDGDVAEAPAATEASKQVELPPPAATPCLCCNSVCCTKAKREAATAKMKGAYKGVFYANDFSYLNDPCYDGPSFCGDALKGLHGGKLDIGGELRFRYHNEKNHATSGLGLTGNDNDFWLTRYRMFANYRMNQYFRFYGEYLYADAGGRDAPSRPIEINRSEIQNLFVDTQLTQSTSVRLGRQELLLGAQRLVSPLDWSNTRRTFDGGRFTYEGCTWTVDGFFVHPVINRPELIDDTNEDVDFFGVYATRGDLPIGTFDAYYIGLNNDALNFDYHTVGSRVAGQSDGGVMYEMEGGVQFGENTNGSDHEAGFFTAGLGRKLSVCTHCGEWNPIVWLWYDWASGGDDIAAARGDNSFDHLFPLAHKYNGFMDLFGRRNLNDVNVQFITPVLGSKVKLLLWYHYFFLDQKTTPYSVVMTPFNPGVAAGDRELGHEIDVLFNITLNPRHSALLGYSYFSTGDYYDTTAGVPTTEDAQFFYAQYQMRF